MPAYSLSALERYQDCPFKFFAADVLKLEEPPEDEPMLSPRARGRFVHEVFQRFFEAWDARGRGTITVERIDEARQLFHEVAEPLLARFSEAEALLERARLFGSAVSVGIVDVVLGLEASRQAPVRERWLEYRFDGAFSLGATGGSAVPIQGRGRSYRSSRRQPAAGHRLQVGLRAAAEARVAGADLRALCPGTTRPSVTDGPGRSTKRRTSRLPASVRSCASSSPSRPKRPRSSPLRAAAS